MDLITLAVLAAQAMSAPAGTAPATGEVVPASAAVAAPATQAGPILVPRFVAVGLPDLRVTASPAVPAPADTVFEYSAAYYRRLDVHRIGSYAMLPLFAFQYLAGTQLYDKSFEAPGWARTGHRVAATGVAVLFSVNTVTGMMNLWEGRKDPEGRGRKLFHATMMLLADAGFVTTGILAERAESSGDDRDLHRTVALTSVGVATIGYLSMLDIFRRD